MNEITKQVFQQVAMVVCLCLVLSRFSFWETKETTKPNDRLVQRRDEFLQLWESHAFVSRSGGWILQDVSEIMSWKGCDANPDGDNIEDPEAYTRIPTDDDYELLVKAYLFAMSNPHNSTHHAGGKYARKPSVKEYNATHWEVPVGVKSMPQIGRGVFATKNISNGTLVCSSRNSLVFYSLEAYRDFLAYLVLHNSELFCDHFLWFYSQSVPGSKDPNDYTITLDADSSSLVNSGDWDRDDGDDDDGGYYGYDGDDSVESTNNIEEHLGVGIFALRDIRAGEELRMSYGDFSEPEGWRMMGIANYI